MPRSAILTGRIDARHRAKARHRQDRRPAPTADPWEELTRFLDGEAVRFTSIEDVERYDLDAYLRSTGAIDLPPGERLRQLAIRLETLTPRTADSPVRAWLALDRVYALAVRLAPTDVDVWTSRGISAVETARGAESDAARRIADAGTRALHRALEIEPTDAHAAYAMGLLVYHTADRGKTEEALSWLERALASEPAHATALLYRAHSLHDLARWPEAIAAYDAVPLEALVGPRAWRVDYVLEARAECRLRSGDREGALAEFDALLSRYEREPSRARYELFPYLGPAAKAELAPELGARFEALMRLAGES